MRGNNLLAKNKVMCTCGKCPTYHDCTKGKIETMFLFGWQNFLHAHQKSLPLSDPSGYPIIGLSQGYYCMSGSKKRTAGYVIFTFFRRPPKNEPHIRVLAGFLRSGWGKVCDKIHLNLKGLKSHQVRCRSALFWQTERILSIFSTRNKKKRFTGFSGIGNYIWTGKGVHFGRIFPDYSIPSKHPFLIKHSAYQKSPLP